jgi:hypothetical protein
MFIWQKKLLLLSVCRMTTAKAAKKNTRVVALNNFCGLWLKIQKD